MPTPIINTYDMLKINGKKGWIRDSWSRRKIETLQTQVATLQNQVTTLQSNYTALEARVTALEGGNTT